MAMVAPGILREKFQAWAANFLYSEQEMPAKK